MNQRGIFLLGVLTLLAASPAKSSCDKPILFFDLGENTLLYTGSHFPAGDPHGDLVNMHYLPGVREYLQDLVGKGYSVNLIVNVPEGWGVEGLENYVGRPADPATGDPGGMVPGAVPFDWNLFHHILVPFSNEDRKPEHEDLPFAPGELWLYQQAMKLVSAGCPALFQTGIKEEILAAEATGMFAWLHPDNADQITLMPEADFQTFIESHQQDVNEVMAEQKQAEAEYAARGEVIPRRSSGHPTE